jgi:hypothetical protein
MDLESEYSTLKKLSIPMTIASLVSRLDTEKGNQWPAWRRILSLSLSLSLSLFWYLTEEKQEK